MQDWAPERYDSVEHLCEVVLGAIKEKMDAHFVCLVLHEPDSKILWLSATDKLTCHPPSAESRLPTAFLDSALLSGQIQCEPFTLPVSTWDQAEPPLSQVRAAIPLKRSQHLAGVVYLETCRRVDRLAASQRHPLQLLTHYLAAELETRILSGRIDVGRDELQLVRRDLDQSLQVQDSLLTLLRSLHQVGLQLSTCQSERELLRQAVTLARSQLEVDRMAIFLVDEDQRTMRGSWGTAASGELIDESDVVGELPAKPMIRQVLSSKDRVVVQEQVPLYQSGQQVGRGWLAMISLWHDNRPLGWIETDNLLLRSPWQRYHAEIFKQFAATLSHLLLRQRTEEALRRLNQEQELRVTERTEQLARANDLLEQANRQLSAMSLEDPLTGIANRRHWDLFVATAWERARRASSPLAVLMLDVDDFKSYNDKLGHPQGDDCLRRIAATLQDCERRRSNLVARYGGEEFAILLFEPQHGEAEMLAERIHRALDDLAIAHPGSRVASSVTVSIGLSYMIPSAETDWSQLMSRADQALYRAKAQGRACTHPFL